MSFSFEDYLLYTKAPEIDYKLFSVLAPGVLEYIKETYGIYLQRETISYTYKLDATGTTFTLPLNPINEIKGITFNGEVKDFSYYGYDIVMTTATTDARIPLIVLLDVGYTTIPDDLKMAVYLHLESIYFRSKNSIDNIEKVLNSSGSTTYFSKDIVPALSKSIYDRYSKRIIALF